MGAIKANRKQKILIFSHSSLLGGGERSMIDLATVLSSQGFFILIVLPEKGPIEKELKQRSIPFMIVRYCWWADINKATSDQYLQSVNNIVSNLPRFAKFTPSCIITNTAVIPWGMLTAQLLNIPHVWNVREFVEKDHALTSEITFAEMAKLIYNGSEKIWFVSKAVKDEFEKFIPSDKGEVIYSQVASQELLSKQSVESPYKFSSSFKLIMSSNVYHTKGQDQAIKAIKRLIDKNYDVELLLLGRKRGENLEYVKTLTKLIGSKYKDRIHLFRFVNNPYPYILMSDVLLVCSRSEAFSRIMIESGLLGKTFVASDTGANSEVDSENGLFYKYGDPNNLAEKIEYLIKNPDILSQMSKDHQKLMQTRFEKNKIITDTIPTQLRTITKKKAFPNTFELIRKILDLNQRGSYYETIESLTDELNTIKSSKTYRMWQRYAKIRDNILDFFKIKNIKQ